MSFETYRYDQPLGIYGFESRQRLAETVVQEVLRYEKAQPSLKADDVAETPESEHASLEAARISSLVSRDRSVGYALVVSPDESEERRGTSGLYYSIDLDGIEVLEAKSFFVGNSSLLPTTYAIKAEVAEMENRFNKPELEAIFRMMGKLIMAQDLADRSGQIEPPPQDKGQPYRTLDEAIRNREIILKRAASVEPHVLRALQHYMLDNLSIFFPGNAQRPPEESSPSEPLVRYAETMPEWDEFLEAAAARFRREDDNMGLAEKSLAIEHMDAHERYIINLRSSQGKLTAVRLLRFDEAGSVFDESFPLDAEEADALTLNPRWNQGILLEAMRNGEPIAQFEYDNYLKLANTQRPSPIRRIA